MDRLTEIGEIARKKFDKSRLLAAQLKTASVGLQKSNEKGGAKMNTETSRMDKIESLLEKLVGVVAQNGNGNGATAKRGRPPKAQISVPVGPKYQFVSETGSWKDQKGNDHPMAKLGRGNQFLSFGVVKCSLILEDLAKGNDSAIRTVGSLYKAQ